MKTILMIISPLSYRLLAVWQSWAAQLPNNHRPAGWDRSFQPSKHSWRVSWNAKRLETGNRWQDGGDSGERICEFSRYEPSISWYWNWCLCCRSFTTWRSTWWRPRENRDCRSSGCSRERQSWRRESSLCSSGSSTSWWRSNNPARPHPLLRRGKENSKRKCCSKRNLLVLQWSAVPQVCVWLQH